MVLNNDNLVPGGNEGPGATHLNFGSSLHKLSPFGTHKLSLLLLVLLVLGLATFIAYDLLLRTNGNTLQTKSVMQQDSSATSTEPQTDDTPVTTPSDNAASNDQHGSHDTTTNTNSTSVTVNGQAVPVPQNGSYSETVDTPGGQATVNGDSSHSTTTSGNTTSNSSSTTVHINSQ